MPIFDRFIRYQWAEHALELAVQNQPPFSIRNWLRAQGLKDESARRTANILIWLWFPKEENAIRLRNAALKLFTWLTLEERRALHWSMALVVFPTFRQTVQICGRLLRLQNEFSKQDVINRVLEQYSNQTTIKRSVERILQTLVDWSILSSSYGIYKPCAPVLLENPALGSWVLRCVLESVSDRYLLVTDLVNAGDVFPFKLLGAERLLHESPYFSFHRNSNGEEVVGANHL